jgi:hypothetical protein
MTIMQQWLLTLMYIMTVTTSSTPQGLLGELEKLHYDITSSSRVDALSNTGYSYNSGISSSYLNPSLISDTGLARFRFGISYGFSFTPPITYEEQKTYYYERAIHKFSLRKHHAAFIIPHLSQKRTLGGIGIDLDHINSFEDVTRFYPNRSGSISEKSNLLTIAYGLQFLTLGNLKNFIGLSAKVDFYKKIVDYPYVKNFYNEIEDYPDPEGFYIETKKVRYFIDVSYSSHFFNKFHLSCILRNIQLGKETSFAFPIQLIIPASYQFNFSEKVTLSPEFCYQYTCRLMEDDNDFSAGSELNINRFLFLRMGCTLEIKKFSSVFEPQNDNLIETTFKMGSGIGFNIKGIAVDASFKRNYQANYFGITISYHAN